MSYYAFGLTDEQEAKLNTWLDEQSKLACEMQKDDAATDPDSIFNQAFTRDMIEQGHPYYGAIGGALTFEFTPTSIGCAVKVKHGYTKNEIDLSDYDSW